MAALNLHDTPQTVDVKGCVFLKTRLIGADGTENTVDMPGIRVEQTTATDLALVAPLFDQYRVFYGRASDEVAAYQFLQERISNHESIVFLAMEQSAEKRLGLGFVQLYPTFSSVSLKPLLILNDLFVCPAYRNRGVATALMNAACSFAESRQAKGLTLQTAITNTTAQQLYEKLGYRRDESFYRYELTLEQIPPSQKNLEQGTESPNCVGVNR